MSVFVGLLTLSACGEDSGVEDAATDSMLSDSGGLTDADVDTGGPPPPGDYYVAPDGDDGAPGTEARPFATVQAALDVATAGDLIYLRGGTYYPTRPTRFRVAGTSSDIIVVRGYPGELPVIDGRDVPEGDITRASTPTWTIEDAAYLRIVGPIRVTNGRGAGIAIEGDTTDIEFRRIESSYNGQRASRGAHGFWVGGASWTNASRIRFIDCDAHHNANHLTMPGEDVMVNQYQHGDGWRIMSGSGIELTGCRAWYNMDDSYDFTQAPDAITLTDCWAAYGGLDDPEGSITGTPGAFSECGQGFKVGYDDDVAEHRLIRTVAWGNKESGYFARGGRYTIFNAISFRNGAIMGQRRGFYFPPASFGREHEIRNSWAFDDGRTTEIVPAMTSTNNSWDSGGGFTVSADDFVSLDEAAALGPRRPNGSLPVSDFLRLAPGSDLIDRGADVGEPYNGSAPDIGAFESP